MFAALLLSNIDELSGKVLEWTTPVASTRSPATWEDIGAWGGSCAVAVCEEVIIGGSCDVAKVAKERAVGVVEGAAAAVESVESVESVDGIASIH